MSKNSSSSDIVLLSMMNNLTKVLKKEKIVVPIIMSVRSLYMQRGLVVRSKRHDGCFIEVLKVFEVCRFCLFHKMTVLVALS